jgi:CRISPR-associated helicase Cas3/CRISPR-associated endonuclease Cas3-HD
MNLSDRAKVLWAKLARDGGEYWLPLHTHMRDAAETAKRLWNDLLPCGVRKIIAEGAGIPLAEAERLFIFLAAAHDLGKATPLFQLGPRRYASPALRAAQKRVRDKGFSADTLTTVDKYPHAFASQAMLVERGAPDELAVILGGHHGVPPSQTENYDFICRRDAWPERTGFISEKWRAVQDELYSYALRLAGIDGVSLPMPNIAAQALLSGLVIMADWIASGNDLFPLIGPDEFWPRCSGRADTAWERLNLPSPSIPSEEACEKFDLYSARFTKKTHPPITPRPMQAAALETALRIGEPGIFIIEAPMGEGKTEAALVAAEVFMAKSGRGGLYFALPTQATSDGLFPRILDWIKAIGLPGDAKSILLAHGKSRFNEDYKGISSNIGNHTAYNVHDEDENAGNVIVHDWFDSRKKSLLADFVVGTVDHVLMGALRQKHLVLRHLGLAGKVVVIDECHAYDAYMNSYLHRILAWLGAYRVPVILLSATLPARSRRELAEAYLDKKFVDDEWTGQTAYPLITFSDGGEVKQILPEAAARQTKIRLARLEYEEIGAKLDELLAGDGCAGIIVNTVARAQELAERLAKRFDNDAVRLLHARFIATDRVRKELALRETLGPEGKRPEKIIVVGTQVMEQSLDVDFDVLITDICPMDLLLQRMGRLHRHAGRIRPEKLSAAQCYITGIMENGFESGAKAIYGNYLLMNTEHLLRKRQFVTLPDDISPLVQAAYAENGLDIDGEEYGKAKDKQTELKREKERRADLFQIRGPTAGKSLVGWLNMRVGDSDPTGRRADAAVRDGADSIEVIVIQRRSDGKFYTLPWIAKHGNQEIPTANLDEAIAGAVAGCTVKLPPALSGPWAIDKTIRELEQNNIAHRLPPVWENSSWLKGELFLVLDEKFSCDIAGFRLRYDEKYGLFSENTRDA